MVDQVKSPLSLCMQQSKVSKGFGLFLEMGMGREEGKRDGVNILS